MYMRYLIIRAKCTCFLPLQLYQCVTVNYKTTAELQQNNNNLEHNIVVCEKCDVMHATL